MGLSAGESLNWNIHYLVFIGIEDIHWCIELYLIFIGAFICVLLIFFLVPF